jgi:hypothetical protein
VEIKVLKSQACSISFFVLGIALILLQVVSKYSFGLKAVVVPHSSGSWSNLYCSGSHSCTSSSKALALARIFSS